MNRFRNLLFAVIAVAAAAGFVVGGPSFHSALTGSLIPSDRPGIANSTDDVEDTNPAENNVATWSHGRDGADANAEEHWRRHGSEFFGDRNAQEYEDEASRFVHHPPPGAEIKHRANGDTLIYDPETNTFAVEDRNGEPRTMFKPDRGEAYWDRQR